MGVFHGCRVNDKLVVLPQMIYMNEEKKWYEGDVEDEDYYSFKDYDVTSTPNDFNTKTIIDFIQSGLFKIPGFQRNYVWDIKRASKLIESVIIGLPIPQVYLYEESKNSYLVIDGQQRLLTLFFFSKMRFPKKDKRFELRQVFSENGVFPESYLYDGDYFEEFNLKFAEPGNRLNGLNYGTMGEYKNAFDFRTIRNIMIKQNFPTDDDSAMFEIFNRLNSGGVVLKPQEIRTSLYHSPFYNELYKLNLFPPWRQLLNQKDPDIHMKDIEILLRAFAMLIDGDKYAPSMTAFLNHFSKKTKSFNSEVLEYSKELFSKFCEIALSISPDLFLSRNSKFSITTFESLFVAMCRNAFESRNFEIKIPNIDTIRGLKENPEFIAATQDNTAGKKNVETRLRLANDAIKIV